MKKAPNQQLWGLWQTKIVRILPTPQSTSWQVKRKSKFSRKSQFARKKNTKNRILYNPWLSMISSWNSRQKSKSYKVTRIAEPDKNGRSRQKKKSKNRSKLGIKRARKARRSRTRRSGKPHLENDVRWWIIIYNIEFLFLELKNPINWTIWTLY